MKLIKENIEKISLNELGEDKQIWGVMLPQIWMHLNGEPSIFDGIQCNRPFEGYTPAGASLVESDVIAPWLEEYWKCSENGAYTFEWTDKDNREFSDYIKARWSYLMWLVYEAINGTLNENLTFKATLGTTWEKILDEDWNRDFNLVRFLCGDIDETACGKGNVDEAINEAEADLPF